MQNIILSYPNRIDAATITGGSWLSALPAQNLANRELWKVARSTDAALASTKFSVDLGEDRLLRCFALANHNLSAEARWLVKVFGEENPVNLCLYSEQFENAYWSKAAVTIEGNATIAPDGTLSADKIVEANGFFDQSIGRVMTLEIGVEYSLSFFAKPDERSWLRIAGKNYASWVPGKFPEGKFDLSNGSVVGYTGSRPAEIEPIGSGLYRCTIFGVPALANCGVIVSPLLTGGVSSTYTGDGLSGIYIWGAQVEAGGVASTYKPTTSAPSNIALLYSSQWQDVWQMAFDNLVEWGSAAWWNGTAGDEYYRSPYPALLAMPDFTTARYVTVEIDDTANPDGYVQIGRPFAGGGIQPATNASYGLQDSWRDLSTMDASESGSAWATERRRLRGVSFVFDHLTPSEAAYIHEMQRLLGTINEVLYFPYPDDPGESQRYGFIGRLSELSAIEYPYYKRRSNAFKIEEIG